MEREPLLTAAVYDAPETNGKLTLYPLIPYHLRFMERHGINPETSTTGQSLALLYMFTHGPKELMAITEESFGAVVDEFSASLTFEQVNEISEHIEAKFAELEASQSASAGTGKPRAKARSRASKP